MSCVLADPHYLKKRNMKILQLRDAGMSKNSIHRKTGLDRTLINRVIWQDVQKKKRHTDRARAAYLIERARNG